MKSTLANTASWLHKYEAETQRCACLLTDASDFVLQTSEPPLCMRLLCLVFFVYHIQPNAGRKEFHSELVTTEVQVNKKYLTVQICSACLFWLSRRGFYVSFSVLGRATTGSHLQTSLHKPELDFGILTMFWYVGPLQIQSESTKKLKL